MSQTSRWFTWHRIVDFFLAAALFAIPVCLGGRTGWGQLVLVLSAAGAGISWSLGRASGRLPGYRWSRAEPVLLAGIGLLILQVISLPPELLKSLSPRIAEWLPLWTSEGLGRWSTLSFAPVATTNATISVAAMALLFAVACQRIRTINDVEWTLRGIALAAGLMAVFGLIQYVAGNGKFFWFYEHPFTTTAHRVKGTFTNKNHFAQFMALGAAPMAWWLLKVVGRNSKRSSKFAPMVQRAGTGELKPGLILVGLGLVIFTGLLALSRGGALALATTGIVSLYLFHRHQQISGRLIAGLIATALLIAGSLTIYGFQDVSDRLEDWNPGVRLAIWDANVKIFEDFLWTGTGLGTHAEAYRHYLAEPYQLKEFTHAENSPLQVASETGLLGLGLTFAAILGCLNWCRRGVARGVEPRVATAAAVVTAALLAHLVHALFDFLWYIPGCMIVVALLAACARALAMTVATSDQPAAGESSVPGSTPRLGWITSAVTCTLMLGFSVVCCWPRINASPHWNEYLAIQLTPHKSDTDTATAPAQRQRESQTRLVKRLDALHRTLQADPQHARAHLRLAAHYKSLFEHLLKTGPNPNMPFSQIRQASFTAGFTSHEERNEWLNRPGVLGKHRKYLQRSLVHSRQGLELCPLQGMGYIYLSQLGFLNGADHEASQTLIEQALLVRPFEPNVQYQAGKEALLQGDQQQGLKHWKQAFASDRRVQRRILLGLVRAGFSARDTIKHFHPDWNALSYMKDLYQQEAPEPEYQVVLAGYADVARKRAADQDGADAVTSWLKAAGALKQLKRHEEAETCYQQALQENPSSLSARLGYGLWLSQQQRFTQAAGHLNWCARQRPGDKKLQRLARQTRQAAITANRRSIGTARQ